MELENNLAETIIEILNNNGFQGIDALNQLSQIYQIIQNRSIKDWHLKDEEKFIILKDSIWYNFEYLPQSIQQVGKTNLKTLGSKFPLFTSLFIDSAICSKFVLNDLLKEIDIILNNWKNFKYLVNLTSNHELEPDTEIIIYRQGESPNKYSSDTISHILDIVDSSGNNIKTEAKAYAYAEITGPINDAEQSNIYYFILKDLKDNINLAIQYHKELRLVV